MDSSDSDSESALIKKEIIYRGSEYIPLVDGTKVCFTLLLLHTAFNGQFICNSGKIPLSNENMLR